jgi:uncharacterized ion transporter superfamily protein YfcC
MIKKLPHTFVIIFYLILVAAALTWVIPGGKYTEVVTGADGSGQKQLVFQYTENVSQWWQVFSSFYKGFVKQSGIIIFILLIGGAFWIMNSSKAIDTGIYSFIGFTRRIGHYRIFRKTGVEPLILSLIWLMFSIFGAVFGMSEETIAFIIVLVPLAISMGYDSITGVAIVFVAAGIGFAGAMLNPFTIGIAQGISGLPLFSGLEYRFFCWIVLNILTLGFLLRYAAKVKRNPRSSPVYETDAFWREQHLQQGESITYYTPRASWVVYGFICLVLLAFSLLYPSTTLGIGNLASVTLPVIPSLTIIYGITGFLSLRKSVHFFLLQMLLFTILFLITGVMGYQWYIMEIAALFFAMGIFAGLSIGKSTNELVSLFMEGVKDILPAALIVGLAGGIIVILEDGQVIDTILFRLSEAMKGLGKVATVGFMYLIQTGINLVMVSGSAKAALTMPIFAPFSDLVGLSRQATVMAYQFGDGFTNMITPASAVLMGVLGVARIPYEVWVKWIFRLIIFLIIIGFILLIPTVTMELEGF